jgi:DNA-binding transcriptional LysR family regulator
MEANPTDAVRGLGRCVFSTARLLIREFPMPRLYYKEIRYEHFRTFCAVAHHGSYSAAGIDLHLSRSTVWQQIESLERDFGVKLTRRRGRGMELTSEGRTLLELVDAPVTAMASIKDAFRARLGQRASLLRLAVIPGTELMEAIRQLRRQSPDVQLTVTEKRSKEAVPLVEDGTCDLGFVISVPDAPWSPRLHVEPVDHRSLALVTPPKHPLARKPRLTLEDIVRYPLITFQSDNPIRRWLEAFFERAGLLGQMHVVVESDHLDMSEQCVALGLGVGLGTHPRGRRPTVAVHVRVLDALLPPLPLVLLWKKGKLLTPCASAFVELVKATGQGRKRR